MRVLGCVACVVLVSGAVRAGADDRKLDGAPGGEAVTASAGSATEPAAPAPTAAVTTAAVPTAAVIERARQQVLDERYQSALPAAGDERTTADPRRRAAGELGDVERQAMRDTRSHGELEHGSSFMTMILWGLVIVVGVLVASWLASELARDAGEAELPRDADARARMAAASAAIIDRPLGDADELAGRGAFADAIHTLLLRTLHELARSAAVRVAPAMTSREILARVPLLADARGALAGLITAVEITHFGEAPASAEDYARCRQQFHVFAAAFRGAQPGPGEALVA